MKIINEGTQMVTWPRGAHSSLDNALPGSGPRRCQDSKYKACASLLARSSNLVEALRANQETIGCAASRLGY